MDDAMAAPLAGITDAIQAAEAFLFHARAHRDRPENQTLKRWAQHARHEAIEKLGALK